MKKDTEFTTGTGDIMPSSRRETEEDMLEQFCILANKRMEITIPDICRRMDLPFLSSSLQALAEV